MSLFHHSPDDNAPDPSLLSEEALRRQASLFMRIMTASKAYVEKFGGEMSKEGSLARLREEMAECMEAVEAYDNACESEMPVHEQNRLEREAAGETIDLLVTIGGYLAAHDVRVSRLLDMGEATLNKLATRTQEDYAWDAKTKTVMKKSKMGGGEA